MGDRIINWLLFFQDVIVLAMIIIVHEAGHYVAFRLFGIKIKFYPIFGAIQAGDNSEMFRQTPAKHTFVGIAGILAGIPILLAYGDVIVAILYITIGCVQDFVTVVNGFRYILSKNYRGIKTYGLCVKKHMGRNYEEAAKELYRLEVLNQQKLRWGV